MLKLSSIFIFLTLLCFQISAQWQANGTAIYNTNSGNVGIGTTIPSAKLSVVGSIYKLTLSGIDGTYDNLIKYGHKSDLESGTSYANRWHGIDATITAGAALDNKLKFRLYSGGYGNLEPIDVLTLLGNGNVGIGTISPNVKLVIAGSEVMNLNPDRTAVSNIRSGSSFSYSGNMTLFTEDGISGEGIDIDYWNGSSYYSAMRINNVSSGFGNILLMKDGGNVLIGKSSQTGTGTRYKLDVEGPVRAHEIVVNTTGADFVFEPTYKLRSLSELETFIRTNKHLPDIAPAKEMQENGISAGEMQAKLLQKVEELTLYVIEKDKEIAEQRKVILEMKKRLDALEGSLISN